MLKSHTFEDYLQDRHADQYYGTDDMMPDDFNDWLSGLDINDYIEWADLFGKAKYLKGYEDGVASYSPDK